jgi:hypothetical protein
MYVKESQVDYYTLRLTISEFTVSQSQTYKKSINYMLSKAQFYSVLDIL